jgi:hypothetical protein
VLRKTVAIAGLIVIVAALLLVVESQRPRTQAAASVSGSPLRVLPTGQHDSFLSLAPGEDAYLPLE